MKRTSRGFTMAEVLSVVAILAVLAAVAIPGIVKLRDDLKTTELNECAREIFLTAQNNLTARKAAGTLGKWGTAGSETNCFWLSSADPAVEKVLPAGSIEAAMAAGNYMVWYNAESAAVLEVYYTDAAHSLPALDQLQTMAYSDRYQSAEAEGGGTSPAEKRRAEKIGYYGGNDLVHSDTEQLYPPLLEITGEDDLTVTVTVPDAPAAVARNVKLTVTVEELDGAGTVVAGKQVTLTDGLEYNSVTGIWSVTLDSLTQTDGGGNRIAFANTCAPLTPGANIRVTATLSAPEQGGKHYLSAQAREDANSLFSGRETVGGKDTVTIACPRHLQNLDPAYSGHTGADLYVEQSSSIEWPAAVEYQSITATSGEITAFNGNGLEIRGLWGSNGLFSWVMDARLEGIRIVNPKIQSGGGTWTGAGALAGTAVSTDSSEQMLIRDCRVYLSAPQMKDGKWSENYEAYPQYGIFGDNSYAVGGLVGYANKVRIEDSFSALHTLQGSNAVGGLVGAFDNGVTGGYAVQNCYASVEQLGGAPQNAAAFVGFLPIGSGVRITNCYAVGNLSAQTGILSGFANGDAAITNSYCAVTYNKADGTPTGVSPAYGFSSGGDASCAYLAGGFTAQNSGSAQALSYTDLKSWSGTAFAAAAGEMTHPYREGLSGKAYPFPGVKDTGGSVLPHYGSWPEQSVNGIKLYDKDTAGARTLTAILVPKGGTVTFWVEPQCDGRPAMVEPEVGGLNGTLLEGVSAEKYDSATGRRAVTVEANRKGTAGTTHLDLTAEGVTLRAVVVVYEAEVTLNARNLTDDSTAQSRADSGGTEIVEQLTLRSTAKSGVLTAQLSRIEPSAAGITGYLASIQPGAGEQIEVSASAADFEKWEQLRSGDPAVTANGDPGAGAYILAPVDGSYYPKADDSGALTVTGAASGTATVSARWAMDESLEARCNVKMEGARALIQKAKAEGKDGLLGEKDNYPYRLDLKAEPEEEIKLTFVPRLFDGSATDTGQSYTWVLYRNETDGTRTEVNRQTTRPTDPDGDAYSYVLKGSVGRASYTVTLEYVWPSTGERSMDYTTFTVYCAAKKHDDPSGAVKIAKAGGQGFLSGYSATVEQINGGSGSGYEQTAELTLQGWVAGAENTRVRWSYSTDGTEWKPVTGTRGSIPIYESLGSESQRMRATVQWMNNGRVYDDPDTGSQITGGAVLVTGKDAHEYDSDFTFQLKAEAVEAMDNGSAVAAARIVTVSVMRQLRINPQTAMTRQYNEMADRLVTFSANRDRIGGWSYGWSISDSGEASTILQNAGPQSQSVQAGIDGQSQSRTITLSFGPHTSSATLGTVSEAWFGETKTRGYINRDGTDTADRDYFLVEKGAIRSLDFAWFTSTDWNLTTSCLYEEPGGGTNYLIEEDKTKTNTKLGTYKGSSNWTQKGERHYLVSGQKFTGDTADTLEWKLQQRAWLFGYNYYDIPASADLYVVGMDLRQKTKQGSEIVSDRSDPVSLAAPGATADLTADWSFPASLLDPAREPEIVWEIDNPDLIAFGTDISATAATDSGEDVTIVARRYSAVGYSATIEVKCTVFCINGREYTYTKYISVVVPPAGDMTVTVEPCEAGDIAGLNTAFGGGLTADSLLAAVDENGVPVLIRESTFGCNTLYLKLRASMKNGDSADLNDYFCNVYGDKSFVDMKTALSADGKTMYLKLQAVEANAEVHRLNLSAAIGSAQKTLDIDLYDTPTVTLKKKDGKDSVDVTNGSIPVYLNDTGLSLTLEGKLTPTLYSASDTGRTTPLDQLRWQLQASAGYNAETYFNLSAETGSTVTLSLKESGGMPDFRVVLRACSTRSDLADAGYALVFLPENRSS